MPRRPTLPDQPGVHRLDTRAAELAAELRRMVQPVLDEPVPEDLQNLCDQLEVVLREAEAETSPPRHPEGTDGLADDGTKRSG